MTSARSTGGVVDLAAPLLDEAGVHEADVAADDGGDVDAGLQPGAVEHRDVGVGGGEDHVGAPDGLPGAVHRHQFAGHQGLHFFTEGRAGLGGAAEELHLLEVAYGGEGEQVVLGFGPRPEQAQDRGVFPREVAGAHRAGGGGAQLGGAGGGHALHAETAHQNPFEGGVGGIEEDDARTAHVIVGLVVRGRGHELRVGQHADTAQAGHATGMYADAGALPGHDPAARRVELGVVAKLPESCLHRVDGFFHGDDVGCVFRSNQ